MSSINEIQKSVATEIGLLNERIADSLKTSNSLMNKVVDHQLAKRGKQLRPLLTILSAKLLGDVDDRVIDAAAALEVLHNATLIHDDVVDETKLRRGQATVNALWDNHIAVLVGDFFVSTALELALRTGDVRIVGEISCLGKTLSMGEIDQINIVRTRDLSVEAYLEAIYRKTASLFESCVRIGGFACDGEIEKIETLSRFARRLGLCFQIRDDIFDYVGDAGDIGKPVGNDLREGKITLPLLHALSVTGDAEMLSIATADFITPENIGRLIKFARDNGGIEEATRIMHRLAEEALGDLRQLGAEPAKTQLFETLLGFVIDRNS